MTDYAFTQLAGGTLAFVPAQDRLLFPADIPAAALRFVASGSDLLLLADGEVLRLAGIGLGGSGLTGANLVFADGSILITDGNGSNTRTGTGSGDWIGIERGGADTVRAGAGDDHIHAGSALDAADSIDGGEGSGDSLSLSGTLDVAFLPGTLTGVERIEAGNGDIRLVLDAATVASATPAPGRLFSVDGSAQTAGSRLVVEGAAAAFSLALTGGGGDDALSGGGAADLLQGGAGDDTLAGGPGDDTIEGGAGQDVLIGGAGDDLFLFDRAGIVHSAPATPDLIADFAGAGRAGGDRIALPGALAIGRSLAFHVEEADFDFDSYEESGLQLAAAWVGDGFADVLWRRVEGQAWRFELWADLDDDGRFSPADLLLRIAVEPGDTATRLDIGDFLAEFGAFIGGEGDDTLYGTGATDDVMWGGDGDDLLYGNDGVDWLDGGPGDDTLFGGDLADELHGGPGSDWLDGGDGWDTLFAADPHAPETESPDDRNMLIGGAGNDMLFGGAGLDTLRGGDGDDLLWGAEGDDSLSGGAGDDILYGGPGADRLEGNEGNDTLVGGPGADAMTGGPGADLFIIDLSTPGEADSTAAETDWLADFRASEGDRISLALIGGLVGGHYGHGPLAWRGSLAARDAASGLPLGLALPGEGIGPGYYQAFWIPLLSGGQPAGGWLVIDLDQDLILDADDVVVRIGTAATTGAEALTPEAFLPGTFRVVVGTAGGDSLVADLSGQEIFGLGGDDLLTGGEGRDRLVGGEGSDTLRGGGGADQLWGGAGNDWLDGGAGDDELFVEGPGSEEVDGIFARNTLIGGLGNDSLWGSDGRDSLDGGEGDDRLYGGVGADTLRGGPGNDTLTGGDGADLIIGGPGADSIDGGAGDDTIDYDPADPYADGGDDFDMLVLSAPATVMLDSSIDQVVGGGITRGFEGVDASAVGAPVTLDGSSGRNLLIGGLQADLLRGGGGNDTLEGGSGADTLEGGAGDDVLMGGPGADRLDGGEGFDLASYADSATAVTVKLATGVALGGAAGDVFLSIEGVRGSAFADWLQGTAGGDRLEGLAGADTLEGLAGDDTLIGGAGADKLRGGAGNDFLFGGDDRDNLQGGEGNDILDGGPGIDWMYGQGGNDLFYADSRGDVVVEYPDGGIDTVVSSANHFMLANVEWLVLAPGAGGVFGVGNKSDNLMIGNEAANLLIGMAGDDTIWGGEGWDRIQGRMGDDVLFGEGGSDIIYGGNGDDWIDGGPAMDKLYGDAGNDTLLGGDGNDVLRGGPGHDWLDGGDGYDVMYGGVGNDTYVASQQIEAIVELPGQGLDLVIARGSGSFTLPANVEYLVLEGPLTGIGNELANRITGSAAAERLFGRDGNDTLTGGGGNDTLSGEAGRDVFAFSPGSGLDVIGDFTPGEDRILLQGFALKNFAQVMAGAREGGGGTILDLAAGDSVQLTGVDKSALHASDFIFLA